MKKVQEYDKKSWYDIVNQYDYESFQDEDLKRRFRNMALLGIAAMKDESLDEFNNLVSKMTGIYGAAKVCPFDKQDCDLNTEGLTLEPGISDVVDNPASHEWAELEYFWQKWRDASGKQMRSQFSRYVDLSNEAALANGKTITQLKQLKS